MPILKFMTLLGAIGLVVLGCVVGLIIALGLRPRLAARGANVLPDAQGRRSPDDCPALDQLIAALPEPAIIVDPGTGEVIRSSRPALAMGLVLGTRLVAPELEEVAAAARPEDRYRERELTLHRSPASLGSQPLLIRTVFLSPDRVAILARDVGGPRQVDEVRRDFVANVSHELKTPVGALALLAEAINMASDDPESVRHFAERIQHESSRLGQLVSDLIDLSRIEADDPLQRSELVDVDSVVREAVEAVALVAQAKDIEIVRGGDEGLAVRGIGQQLLTAVHNLLANAIAYSPPGRRVAVATRRAEENVEIVIADQGIGIPDAERDRIFERFYRVDPARSRVTGGTGLGLAIVKHVCQNHGGSVSLWSMEGEGSTFTLRLPVANARDREVRKSRRVERVGG